MASVDSLSTISAGNGSSLVERGRLGVESRPRGRDAVVAAAAGGGFGATALAFVLALPDHRPLDAATAAILIVAFALVSQVRFEVGSGFGAPMELVVAPMALALPARSLPLVIGAGMVLSWLPALVRRTMPPQRVLVPLGSSWYAVGPAIVLAAGGDPAPGWRHWPLYLGALGAQFAFDYVAGAGWNRTAYGVPPVAHLRESILPWAVDAALAPLGLAVGLRVAQERLAILLVLPLVGLLGYFARERRQRLDHAVELSHAYRGTAFLLGDVIEADDAYTGSHSRAVVELTLAVSDRLGLDADERRDVELTALLHDVGKVRVPASIINKPGPLDPAERAILDLHTVEGERMLEQVGGLLAHVGHIVRSCHEHWDGRGYPDGLAGEEIPLLARIVSCCDAYHAMTTDRAYRRALSLAEARAEVLRTRGTQFDPRVVDALLAVVDTHRPAV